MNMMVIYTTIELWVVAIPQFSFRLSENWRLDINNVLPMCQKADFELFVIFYYFLSRRIPHGTHTHYLTNVCCLTYWYWSRRLARFTCYWAWHLERFPGMGWNSIFHFLTLGPLLMTSLQLANSIATTFIFW